jgi:hypothetical protein
MGYVARVGERRGGYRVLMGRPEEKRPLGRPKHRWEDKIEMDFKDSGWGKVDCINLTQDRERWRAFVNVILNLRIP